MDYGDSPMVDDGWVGYLGLMAWIILWKSAESNGMESVLFAGSRCKPRIPQCDGATTGTGAALAPGPGPAALLFREVAG